MQENPTDDLLVSELLVAWAKRQSIDISPKGQSILLKVVSALNVSHTEGSLCLKVPSEGLTLEEIEVLENTLISDKGYAEKPFVLDRTQQGIFLYYARLFRIEVNLASNLSRFILKNYDDTKARELLIHSSDATTKEATAARLGCLNRGLSVVYGGPGTGKTTILASLLEAFLADNPNLKIALAAPTGKAASRMKQSLTASLEKNSDQLKRLKIRLTAKDNPVLSGTIHKWLTEKNDWGEKPSHRAPLRCDLFVVDEASMVDINLAAKLFDALDPEKTRVILLGDAYQLRAVGPGSFFADLCEVGAGSFAFELKKSWRFDDKSPLGQLALHYKKAQKKEHDSNFQVLKAASEGVTIALVESEHDKALPLEAKAWLDRHIDQYVAVVRSGDKTRIWNALTRFKAIAAFRKGVLGVEAINAYVTEKLQSALSKDFSDDSGRAVIVRKNDAQLGVFNGDTGVILPRKRSEAQPSLVYFGDIETEEGEKIIPLGLLPLSETAFAITIHQSQGSEFHRVGVFLDTKENEHITPELLYTALTRVKDEDGKKGEVALFSSKTALQTVENSVQERHSALAYRLKKALSEQEKA